MLVSPLVSVFRFLILPPLPAHGLFSTTKIIGRLSSAANLRAPRRPTVEAAPEKTITTLVFCPLLASPAAAANLSCQFGDGFWLARAPSCATRSRSATPLTR